MKFRLTLYWSWIFLIKRKKIGHPICCLQVVSRCILFTDSNETYFYCSKMIVVLSVILMILCIFISGSIPACVHCHTWLRKDAEYMLQHSRTCEGFNRLNRSYNYVCFSCDYHSDKNCNMIGHIRKHLGEKPFQCFYCSYSTSYVGDLKKHEKIRHSLF